MFVSVKDAKPKRKVAVPIGDGATWEQFCSQVRGAAPLGRDRLMVSIAPQLHALICDLHSCLADVHIICSLLAF